MLLRFSNAKRLLKVFVLLAVVPPVHANAKPAYFYITPDYRPEMRKRGNYPASYGISKDFPSLDPSREKYLFDQSKSQIPIKNQDHQIRKNLFSILTTNLFDDPGRIHLANSLVELSKNLPDFTLKSASSLLPSKANSFAILNTFDELGIVSNFNVGDCWGVSGVLRKFVMLSIFTPQFRAPFDRDQQKTEYLTYYAKKIETILSGKPAVIPGFKNLRDFSSDPLIELYLKQRIVGEWQKYIGRISFYRSLNLIPQSGIPKRTIEATQQLLQKGLLPKWLITAKSKRRYLVSVYKHVVLPYRAGFDSHGNPVYYTWDPDFYAQTVQNYPTFILYAEPEYVKKTYGTKEYLPLIGLEFPPEELDELKMMTKSSAEFCANQPEFCTRR